MKARVPTLCVKKDIRHTTIKQTCITSNNDSKRGTQTMATNTTINAGGKHNRQTIQMKDTITRLSHPLRAATVVFQKQ